MHASLPGTLAFIGGGNMASAIIGGLRQQGLAADRLLVVEPHGPAREQLLARHGVVAAAEAGPQLAEADLVVWAVKPQSFRAACMPVAPHTVQALHLSVAAGVRARDIARWLGNARIVRAMPNTPALIGQGIAGLYATPEVTQADRARAAQALAATGRCLWVEDEAQLDAVTALSGSGPAYVFFLLEAMRDAGVAMGLPAAQALELAIETFAGAAALARGAGQPPEALRAQVTSKGGTTQAAIASLEADGVGAAFERALQAARARSAEMADEFGAAI